LLSFVFTPKVDIKYSVFKSKYNDEPPADKGDFIDVDGKAE